MSRPIGSEKTPGSGRKKGSVNKKTQKVEDICRRLKCDPIEILVHFAKGDFESLNYEEYQTIATKQGPVDVLTISPDLRQKSAMDLAQFLYPKRKAIEHEMPDMFDDDNMILEATFRAIPKDESNT